MDEETKYLNSTSVQDEDAILSSPKGSTSSKSPEHQPETNTSAAMASAAQHKKVVLKRKLLTSVSTESESSKSISGSTNTTGSTETKVMKLTESATPASAGEKTNVESNESNGNSDGNVVKLSQLSMKERLELRAKKFGAPVSSEVAKLARAERFGLPEAKSTPSGGGNSGGAAATAKIAADVELLKKRAERFGGSVSNTMVKIEMNEKLLKRQERFGGGGGGSGATTTVSGKVETKPISTQAASDYAEKAKLRLERFKTTA